MTESMGDGDRRPGVRQHVIGESADGEGVQGLVRFDLTTPRNDRARQNVFIKFGGFDVQGGG